MADGNAPAATPVRMYPRELLRRWTKNPRTSTPDVRDILATLMVDGKRIPDRNITEPLRLRKEADGTFTALKGNRRLMAAAIAGIDELPGIEVTWSDEEALEEALVDEARKALSPLEEAAALVALRDRGLDVDAIARRAGRSVRHVRQRFALHDALSAEGKKLLEAGRISVALALQLAALGPDAQKSAIDDVMRERAGAGEEPLTTREVEWSIRRARLRLVDGGFPLDDAKLVPAAGACTTCPKRTGTQIALFLDGLSEENLCGDAACFKAKQAARAEQLKAQAKASGLRFVSDKAEVKKLFRYGSLAHDAPVVDLDAPYDLVRPPKGDAPKNEGRSSRADEPCSAEDGEHEWMDFVREDDDLEDDRPAAKAGCEAWQECECGAWREVMAPSWALKAYEEDRVKKTIAGLVEGKRLKVMPGGKFVVPT